MLAVLNLMKSPMWGSVNTIPYARTRIPYFLGTTVISRFSWAPARLPDPGRERSFGRRMGGLQFSAGVPRPEDAGTVASDWGLLHGSSWQEISLQNVVLRSTTDQRPHRPKQQ